MSAPPVLVRPALGEAASLGTLYDARTDSFLPLSALQTQPPSSLITKTDIHDSDTRDLDIKAQLGASFLAGLVNVEGSRKYLSEGRDSNLVAHQSLLYSVTKVSERLEFQTKEVEDSISWSALEKGYATHIVFEIIWGSRSVVTAKQILSREDNAKAVTGNLASQLKCWETFGEGRGDMVNRDESLDRSLEVTVFGDVLPSDGLIPTDLASAFRFLTNIPTYIGNANSGKGKPLTYKLMPISLLAGVVNRMISIPLVINNLETECFENFVQIFDEITAIRQELNDYRAFLGENRGYVPPDHIRSVEVKISESRHLETLLNDPTHRVRVILKDQDAVEEKLDVPRIVLIRNAEVIILDVLQDRKLSSSKRFAQSIEAYLDNGSPKPVRRVVMKIPCPKIYCGSTTSHNWFCTRCGTLIEYGHIDDYLYCDCGRCKYTSWSFRCSNTKHGLDFSTYDSVTLAQLLKSLEPFEELNILGKSTWINAFVNYLSFPSLDEAMNMEKLCWRIPFAFNTYSVRDDGEFEKIKVSYGFERHSENEPVVRQVSIEEVDGTTGESATQNATVHRVMIGECLVRIIDTPGIGDTRGASQDKKNMADILSVIRTYEKLHGILILLKPNEQRLSVTLRFCIQELLTHLHRDAAKNIAFGFTNTRGTSYTPGDTFDPLQAQLNKYRHVDIGLRSRNKQHEKSLGHFEENRKSWEHLVEESKRLLDHSKSILPHRVTSTVNLYETRHRIFQMTEPMAAIAEKIKSTIMINEDQIKDLTQSDLKKKDLEENMKIRVNTLTAVAVENPRTACAHADCVEHSNTGLIGMDGKPMLGTVYKTFHLWNFHLHIKHEYEDGSTEMDNPMVIEALERNASDREKKEAAIASKVKLIEDLELELKMVRDAAAQFSIFLRRNAIMPVNDATLDYLDLQIEQEKGKISEGGSRDKFKRLSDFRKQYEQEVKILTEYWQKGDSQKLLDQADVEGLMQHLYSLQHYGSQLQQANQVLNRIGVISNREKTNVIHAKAHFTERAGQSIKTQKAAAITVNEVAERQTAFNSSFISWVPKYATALWSNRFWMKKK
ncbi:hypothetical protein UA08_06186 [Talaromyces atroroseus]|uniref:Uncharacterized protein n=1 Tax=Talaromyces atroroseus TaxID=1441469 RepID=A0A225ABK4_TALAT|nr:hypothetical protein UA08_06186 [Talaromyces atroroseus]OKL58362.1 hypothetical protein UA08_06186 [Talaromyces atroroseus]